MKKKTFILILAICVAGIIGSWLFGQYNALVVLHENVQNAWGHVENQYQRRSDLIPNLVSVVKGYATHEQSTFEAVADARANATQTKLDVTKATPEQLATFQAAQGELTQALGRLMAVAENYPELKASENFRDLQRQLESTENRVTYARDLFNRTAKDYNAAIRRFPTNIIASMFGFERMAYFQADEGADKAVQIEL